MRPKFTYGYEGPPYNYTKGEILHRDGEWVIRKAPAMDIKWESYIHHSVEKNILQHNPWENRKAPVPLTYLKKIGCEWLVFPLRDNRCFKCLSIIPESLIGLWTLHNFDAIQTYSRKR